MKPSPACLRAALGCCFLALGLLLLPSALCYAQAQSATTGQQPYGGVAWAAPGRIEAEDYDLGGQNVAYYDRSSGNLGGQYRNDDVDIWFNEVEGYYVGGNATGEWLEYTLEVAAGGQYRLDLQVATPNSGRQVRVDLDGVDVSGTITIPNTGGWQVWQTVSTPVNLPAGRHVLRLAIEVGGLNINWIDTVAVVPMPTADPPTVTPDGGIFSGPVEVSLMTITPGAAIHYTTNGAVPTSASPLYTGSFTLKFSATVQAIAVSAGYNDSPVVFADFTLTADGGHLPDGSIPHSVRPYSVNPFYWEIDEHPVVLLGGSWQDNPFQWSGSYNNSILINQLNTMVAVGANYIRNTMSQRNVVYPQNPEFFDVGMAYPFAAINGQYDLDVWNEEHWIRLENFLHETSQRGIIVQLELWDRWSIYALHAWSVSPWNGANNINYSSTAVTRDSFFESIPAMGNNTQVMFYQNKYIDKMLSITLNYDNVLYQINNESEFDYRISDYWANFISQRAAERGKEVYICDSRRYHPVSYTSLDFKLPDHSENKYPLENFDRYTFLDISQNGGSIGEEQYENLVWYRGQVEQYKVRPINHTKLYLFNWPIGAPFDDRTPGNDWSGTARFWRTIFGGGASVRFHRDTTDVSGAFMLGLGLNQLVQSHIVSARILLNEISIFSMEPSNNLLSSRENDEAYCLAEIGEQYAVYFTGLSDRTVEIGLDAQTYEVRWLNIATGTLSNGHITSGGIQQLTAPSHGQWVAIITSTMPATPIETASAPTITPDGGTFITAVEVTLATATPGAVIHYTTNGSIPTPASPVYAGPFTLTSSATVQAVAVAAGYADSAVTAAAFTVTTELPTASAPTITPDGGTFSAAVEVTLATATPGAVMHYTLDGSIPTTASLVYAGPFTLTSSATVRALAAAPGYNDSPVASADFTVLISGVGDGQQPYGGIAWAVPGRIEAEDYDLGGQNVAYYDRSSGNLGGQYRNDDVDIWFNEVEGYYVGGNATGEWLEYTLEVAAGGQYRLDLQVATPNSGRQVRVDLDGVDISGTITLPNTGGWQVWRTVSAAVNLPAGRQVLRVTIVQGGLNLNRMDLVVAGATPTAAAPIITPNGGTVSNSVEVTLTTATAGATIHYTTNGSIPTTASPVYTGPFTLSGNATVQALAVAAGYIDSVVTVANFIVTAVEAGDGQQPYGGVAWAVPGRIEAENYDLGGQNVAYYDRSSGNSGGQYRSDDVDIWYSGNPPEGYYVGGNTTSEWLEYTVDVAFSGEYRLDLRVATPNSGRQMRVDLNGVNVSGTLTLPNTGSWSVWQTVGTAVNLPAGRHVLRLTIVQGGLNFNWIDLYQVGILSLSEDFSNAMANGWNVVNDSGLTSNWQVIDGQYRQPNFVGWSGAALDGGYHLGTYSYLGSWPGSSSYRFSVLAIPFARSGMEIGVMFHYQNRDNYYRLSFSHADGFSRLEKKSGGIFTTLAQNARSYPAGTLLTIVVEIKGGIIQVTVNDEALFSAFDTSLTGGTVGLYCREGCAFDDVSIEPPSSWASIAISNPADYAVFPSAAFEVAAVVLSKPANGTVVFELNGDPDACTSPVEEWPGLFEAQCTASDAGAHFLTATLYDGGPAIDSDTKTFIATGGDYYISIGDSIFWGMADYYSRDGSTRDHSAVMLQGFQPNLVDALNLSPLAPDHHRVFKEAVPGDTSSLLLDQRLPAIIERHPDANFAIVLIGTNDAGGTTPRASGENCSGAACSLTFKGNLQALVDALNDAGIMPVVVAVPPRFGDTVAAAPYADPLARAVNSQVISAYNRIIKGLDQNPISGYILGPDLFDYYLGAGKNRFSLFYDNLHPGALGHAVLAAQIRNTLTGETDLPFVLEDICHRAAAGGSCALPTQYKQDLMEPGSSLYVDQPAYALSGSLPVALEGGRWIRTSNDDRSLANGDYLSFSISKFSQVYVAYDAGAAALPQWLQADSGFIDIGLQIQTTNLAAPALNLYRKDYPAGTVDLGGADGLGTGAAANYVVIVK